METTAVSVCKSALDGALDYAKSMVAEEVALQLGVQRDVAIIADELEMVKYFLMTGDNQGAQTWVTQVRDLAYNVEDTLQDVAAKLDQLEKPSRWRIPRILCERRRATRQVKALLPMVAEVAYVSKRNLYSRLSEGADSEPTTLAEQSDIFAAISAMDEARRAAAAGLDKSKVDLLQLIHDEVEDRRVIVVWGTSGDLGKLSAIKEAFDHDDREIHNKFAYRVWLKLGCPFNRYEFLRGLVSELCMQSAEVTAGAEANTSDKPVNELEEMRKLASQAADRLDKRRFLIVMEGLSSKVDWDWIKTHFCDWKNGSRIIVLTPQLEIASWCMERPCQVSELKEFTSDQAFYLFHKKDKFSNSATSSLSSTAITDEMSKMAAQAVGNSVPEFQSGFSDVRTDLAARVSFQVKPKADSDEAIPGEIEEGQRGKYTEDDVIFGRDFDRYKLLELIGHPRDSQGRKVISVCGMGGSGKTTLVRMVYRSRQLVYLFPKRAWVTVMRPLNIEVLLRSIALQLQENVQATSTRENKDEVTRELAELLKEHECLIVLDDLSSTAEWDSIVKYLVNARRIIVTTRGQSVAKHCSMEYSYIYDISMMSQEDSLAFFIRKVFKQGDRVDLRDDLLKEAKLILRKCKGLPLAISCIGSLLSNKPKTATEWRKLHDNISAEQIIPNLETIKTVLMKSCDGLPYHLKSCFLYMSIFPEDYKIRRKRLVRRWIAEGYSKEMYHMSAEEVGDKHFAELCDRSMILPTKRTIRTGKIYSCGLHDLIRGICISQSMEEKLVFTLTEGCSSKTKSKVRHLVISNDWERDKDVFQRILELSHVRSVTIFGEWRSFFISDKTRFIRVLDLEDSSGLRDHHLDQICQLLHLRYLSLRGCKFIFQLPDSLGNLRQLQTLDVRHTHIYAWPTTIANLQKLQYLRTGPTDLLVQDGEVKDDVLALVKSSICSSPFTSGECISRACLLPSFCRLICRPGLVVDGFNRHDVLNLYHFCTIPLVKRFGLELPRGFGELNALNELAVVNVKWGKATLKELSQLTQLRKLGVTGIDRENSNEFWSAIAGYKKLQSLSVQRTLVRNQELDGCFGGDLLPPQCLESLKLDGELVKVKEWICQLRNLTKLQLERTKLNQDAVQVLGMVPNLVVLRLREWSFVGEQLHFHSGTFPRLVVLQLRGLPDLKSLQFEDDETFRLELVEADSCGRVEEISGLRFLRRLMEIQLRDGPSDECKQKVRRDTRNHPNRPTLRLT